MLKVGTAALVLEMIEAGVPFRDFSLDNPIRAIREVSHDLTGRRPVRLAGGRQASALDIQREYYSRAVEHLQTREPNAQIELVVDLWGRQLDAVESQDFAKVDTEIDWVIKKKLFQRYQDRYDMELSDLKLASSTWPTTTSNGAGASSICCSAGFGGSYHYRRGNRGRRQRPAADDRAKLRGEFISALTGRGPRLHRRLGAPQAQRPGPTHGVVQGPVPLGRRAGQAAHRQHVISEVGSVAVRPVSTLCASPWCTALAHE